MFEDLFGGLFDFNGDGHTDLAEEAFGFAVMEDMTNEFEDDHEDAVDTDLDEDW